jgi:Uma2 family endonuclease
VVLADAVDTGARSRFTPEQVVLAIEIVSPSSQAMDRFTKPALYAAAGIVHYWRIETENGIKVLTYRLDGVTEAYQLTGEFDEFIDVAEPWPFNIPIAEITP